MTLPSALLALALCAAARQEPTEATAHGELRREKTLAAELRARPGFLRRVVFRAAIVLDPSALEPHLAGLLQAGDEPEALRLALRVMPDELARAHAAKLWTPGPEAVRVLLLEIEEEGLERQSGKLLQHLFEARDENAAWAGRLFLRAGGEVGFVWVAEQLAEVELPLRRAWIEACGLSGRKELALELAEWLSDGRDPSIVATGLVALAGLAHAPARAELEELVKGPASERRRLVLGALARVLAQRELQPFAEEALRRDDLAPEERFALGAGLVGGGVPGPRAALRAALPSASGAERGSGIRALVRAPDPDDVEVLATLFPLTGDDALEANALLAAALLTQRNAEAEPFLRAALWDDDWDLCVLAGGLIVRWGGTRALLDELEAAPRGASEADLRRVGFALGEWGGLGVVEELRRLRTESDPVLQGALLGALSARVAEERTKVKEDLRASPTSSPSGDGKPSHPKGEGGKRKRAGKGPADKR